MSGQNREKTLARILNPRPALAGEHGCPAVRSRRVCQERRSASRVEMRPADRVAAPDQDASDARNLKSYEGRGPRSISSRNTPTRSRDSLDHMLRTRAIQGIPFIRGRAARQKRAANSLSSVPDTFA